MIDHVRRTVRCGSLVALLLLGGCARETLFQSNFDAMPINQPPASAQEVGTSNVHGPAGSVIVVPPPVQPSGRWVRVSRPDADSNVAGFQGNLSAFRGDGEYRFSTTMFMPAGSGIATIQFERFGQPVSDLGSFMHIDFTQDNRVRINDNDGAKFGEFPRDAPFIVQVRLNIDASAANAHILLSGAGASGEADHAITGGLHTIARQFGAVRLWMGFPSTGSFNATNINVSRSSD